MSEFKVGQMVRIIKDTKTNSLRHIGCELGQVGRISFICEGPDDIYPGTPDFPVAVKLLGCYSAIYFREEELEVVEADGCAATSCQYD